MMNGHVVSTYSLNRTILTTSTFLTVQRGQQHFDQVVAQSYRVVEETSDTVPHSIEYIVRWHTFGLIRVQYLRDSMHLFRLW